MSRVLLALAAAEDPVREAYDEHFAHASEKCADCEIPGWSCPTRRHLWEACKAARANSA
jgi:hypothetical protein